MPVFVEACHLVIHGCDENETRMRKPAGKIVKLKLAKNEIDFFFN